MKSNKEKLKNRIFISLCISLLAVVLCTFVYTGRDYGSQAMNALYLSAEFQGEYKVAEGDWLDDDAEDEEETAEVVDKVSDVSDDKADDVSDIEVDDASDIKVDDVSDVEVNELLDVIEE